MAEQKCPKCGSDRIFKRRMSQVRNHRFTIYPFTGRAGRSRYTVTGTPIQSVLEDAQAHHRRMRRARMQTRLIGTGLLWRYFSAFFCFSYAEKRGCGLPRSVQKYRACVRSGFSGRRLESLRQGDLDDFGIAGVADAFWRGDNPMIRMSCWCAPWLRRTEEYPDPFEGDAEAQFREATRDYLTKLMKDAGYECEFTPNRRSVWPASPVLFFSQTSRNRKKNSTRCSTCGYRYGGSMPQYLSQLRK